MVTRDMRIFANGSVITEVSVGGKLWCIRIFDVYNPSAEEIVSNKKFNDTLGNWDPEREKPTFPLVQIEVTANDGERFEMYWSPANKVFGPHIKRAGWGRGTFNSIKAELLRWKLPSTIEPNITHSTRMRLRRAG
ncbi:MAG: hypothetical protein LBE62_16465 [Azonexus sp.]|jgi:hypothetical protein|nr:hypothetical protein [Azonexus sp.]